MDITIDYKLFRKIMDLIMENRTRSPKAIQLWNALYNAYENQESVVITFDRRRRGL